MFYISNYQKEIEKLKESILLDYALIQKAKEQIINIIFSDKRDMIEQQMKEILINNKYYFGVWFVGFDTFFEDKDKNRNVKHYGETGQFNTYIYKAKEGISVQRLDNVEQEDFYKKPLDSKLVEVLEPFSYEIDGVPVLMTTVSYLVKNNSEDMGIFGIDITLLGLRSLNKDLLNNTHPKSSKDLKNHINEIVNIYKDVLTEITEKFTFIESNTKSTAENNRTC